jgi:hypothetical protein
MAEPLGPRMGLVGGCTPTGTTPVKGGWRLLPHFIRGWSVEIRGYREYRGIKWLPHHNKIAYLLVVLGEGAQGVHLTFCYCREELEEPEESETRTTCLACARFG